LLSAITATFLLAGILVSAYGPLLEHLSHRFAVSLPVAGSVFTAHFTGGLVGVVASMRLTERLSNRVFVPASLGGMALGCAGIAVAPTWETFLAAVFVLGLGFGAIDIGLNQLVAHSDDVRRGAALNGLNGAFAIGAVVGPILVSILGEHHFALLYACGAIVAAAIIPLGLRIPGRLPVAPHRNASRPGVLVVLFVVAFVLYVGTEVGVGGWMPTHLESLGLHSSTAATLTSGFWLALGLGRLLAALLPPRVPESAVVIACSAVAGITLLAALAKPLAPIAYIATGFAIAPIFPTGIVWLAKLRPGDARATSWLFPAAMVGGAFIPAGVGVVIAQIGIAAAPGIVAAVAFGMLAAFTLALRSISSQSAG
jgi:FHS family glucose/mannose:H+ symporter-like MFS transporter